MASRPTSVIAAAAGILLAAALMLGACAGPAPEATPAPDAPAPIPEVIVEDGAPAEADPAPASEQAAPEPGTAAALFAAGDVRSVRVIGDSITAGWGLPGHDGPSDTGAVAYSGPEGYYEEVPTTVANWANEFRVWAGAHGVESFVNAGVSGFRMQYLAESPESWLGDGADLIVVLLGANDAAKVSVEDFRSYAEQALTAADAACGKLVVVSPPRNERFDAVNLYGLEEIDAVLAEVCEGHGWEFVSLIDAVEVDAEDLQADQVHPTEAGSHKLWLAFAEGLGLPL